MASVEPVLRVHDLVTTFRTDRGEVRAVDHVSFEVGKGETLGLVGESGCGKSVTALSIMRLVATPPGRIVSGSVLLQTADGARDLLKISEREMRDVRGNLVSMIFQEPMTSLNPVYAVGSQIVEAIRIHRDVSRKDARARAIELLKLVGIPSPETNIDAYPHHLSGGMRQRVMIAMALSCEPKVLVADEPTTALDVTIQAQILELLKKLQEKMNMAVLLITHDLGVIAEVASRVVVMYAGRVVEQGTVRAIFKAPRHPYTKGLLESIPRMPREGEPRKRRLATIEGVVPDLHSLPKGCVFQDRCALVIPKCRESEPALVAVDETEEAGASAHLSRCFRHAEVS
ncbi:ABC transporter ATP-binding protein [soil metagenome]